MALVEVVHLDSTNPSVLAAAEAFVRKIGKTPVLCKDTPGFVVNRLLVPYMAQAVALVERGVASFKDVDAAMKLGAGYPMGPFQLADYVGLDTMVHILENWTQMYPGEPAFFVPKLLVDKVRAPCQQQSVRRRAGGRANDDSGERGATTLSSKDPSPYALPHRYVCPISFCFHASRVCAFSRILVCR